MVLRGGCSEDAPKAPPRARPESLHRFPGGGGGEVRGCGGDEGAGRRGKKNFGAPPASFFCLCPLSPHFGPHLSNRECERLKNQSCSNAEEINQDKFLFLQPAPK